MPRYRDNETVRHTFTNQAQVDLCLQRWPIYRGIWRIGYTQSLDGQYINWMMDELGSRVVEKTKLVKWWEVEVANLPG